LPSLVETAGPAPSYGSSGAAAQRRKEADEQGRALAEALKQEIKGKIDAS
jgi:hypothetical protein